jgi:5-methylcytosine-specific restriction endonuclease McrA
MDILSKFGFDPNVVYLGKPCVHGHTLGDTGLTVRYKNTRKQCVTCAQASQKKVKASAKTESASFFHDPESDAILEQHGFNTSKFILGSICKKGHEFEGTGKGLRYRCGPGRYAGKPKDCAQCIEIQRTQWKKDNYDLSIENGRRYYHENRDLLLEKTKAYYQAHRQERIAYTAKWEKEYKARDPEGYAAMRKKCGENQRRKQTEYHKILKNQRFREAYKKDPERYKRIVSQRRVKLKSGHVAPINKKALKARIEFFESKCAYCKSDEHNHWDHFIPVLKGGPDAEGNLIPCCKSCNSSKGAKDPKQWYQNQSFFSKSQWKKILQALGKTEKTYNQMPLF